MRKQLYIKLKELREKNNLTQADVAEYLKISRQAISQWETGKAYPDIENIVLLCRLYGVSIDELMDVYSNVATVKEKQSDVEFDSEKTITLKETIQKEEGNSECIVLDNKQLHILEMLGLAIVLVLTSQIPFVGIVVEVIVAIWMRQTKRNYKIIYLLCLICLFISINRTYIMIDHWFFNLGTPGIEKM